MSARDSGNSLTLAFILSLRRAVTLAFNISEDEVDEPDGRKASMR